MNGLDNWIDAHVCFNGTSFTDYFTLVPRKVPEANGGPVCQSVSVIPAKIRTKSISPFLGPGLNHMRLWHSE